VRPCGPDRTGVINTNSKAMKGGKGPMSAAESLAYDLHMEQMNDGHGGKFRKNSQY